MNQLKNTVGNRNSSIDIFKIVAACFVVFIHAPFPGKTGQIIACIGRIAVPGFFAISGFFSYHSDVKKLKKRIKHMVVLNVWGIVLSLLWCCFVTELRRESMIMYQGSSISYLRDAIPSWSNIAKWLVLDINPFNGTLWYLMASLKCSFALWLYVSFFEGKEPNYSPLYIMGILLFCINLMLGVMSAVVHINVDFRLLRNSLFLGFPMFSIGLFLAQYWEKIWRAFKLTVPKLILICFLGFFLAWLENSTLITADVHIGSVVSLIAVLLLTAKFPSPLKSPTLVKIAEKLSKWSVGVYLIHYIIILASKEFFPNMWNILPTSWLWIWPVAVVLVSIIAAAVNDITWSLIQQFIYTWKHPCK